jgi:bifunctional DNA-binding transcriptional regulator/antitoxin component of YhaV-PrlF toxin-antitoxin module
MKTIKMERCGRAFIPKQLRKQLGLNAGTRCTLFRLGDSLLIFPRAQLFEQLRKQIASTLKRSGASSKSLREQLWKSRKFIYAQHYGKHP